MRPVPTLLALTMILVGMLLLLLAGCGAQLTVKGTTPSQPPKSTSTLNVSWKTNGNPDVPACSDTVMTDCLFGYTALDKTTGQVTQLPITSTGFNGPSVSDDYWVFVDGLDGSGSSLQSTCCEVPVSKGETDSYVQ